MSSGKRHAISQGAEQGAGAEISPDNEAPQMASRDVMARRKIAAPKRRNLQGSNKSFSIDSQIGNPFAAPSQPPTTNGFSFGQSQSSSQPQSNPFASAQPFSGSNPISNPTSTSSQPTNGGIFGGSNSFNFSAPTGVSNPFASATTTNQPTSSFNTSSSNSGSTFGANNSSTSSFFNNNNTTSNSQSNSNSFFNSTKAAGEPTFNMGSGNNTSEPTRKRSFNAEPSTPSGDDSKKPKLFGNSLFGQQSAATPVFGSSFDKTTSSPLFGQPPKNQPTASPLFGSASQGSKDVPTSSTSLFGSSVNGSTSLFPKQQEETQSQTKEAKLNGDEPEAGMTSIFQSSLKTNGNLFGNLSTPQPQSKTQSSTLFGQVPQTAPPKASQPLFASTPKTGSIFGSAFEKPNQTLQSSSTEASTESATASTPKPPAVTNNQPGLFPTLTPKSNLFGSAVDNSDTSVKITNQKSTPAPQAPSTTSNPPGLFPSMTPKTNLFGSSFDSRKTSPEVVEADKSDGEESLGLTSAPKPATSNKPPGLFPSLGAKTNLFGFPPGSSQRSTYDIKAQPVQTPRMNSPQPPATTSNPPGLFPSMTPKTNLFGSSNAESDKTPAATSSNPPDLFPSMTPKTNLFGSNANLSETPAKSHFDSAHTPFVDAAGSAIQTSTSKSGQNETAIQSVASSTSQELDSSTTTPKRELIVPPAPVGSESQVLADAIKRPLTSLEGYMKGYEVGDDTWKKSPEEHAEAVAALSPAQKEAYERQVDVLNLTSSYYSRLTMDSGIKFTRATLELYYRTMMQILDGKRLLVKRKLLERAEEYLADHPPKKRKTGVETASPVTPKTSETSSEADATPKASEAVIPPPSFTPKEPVNGSRTSQLFETVMEGSSPKKTTGEASRSGFAAIQKPSAAPSSPAFGFGSTSSSEDNGSSPEKADLTKPTKSASLFNFGVPAQNTPQVSNGGSLFQNKTPSSKSGGGLFSSMTPSQSSGNLFQNASAATPKSNGGLFSKSQGSGQNIFGSSPQAKGESMQHSSPSQSEDSSLNLTPTPSSQPAGAKNSTGSVLFSFSKQDASASSTATPGAQPMSKSTLFGNLGSQNNTNGTPAKSLFGAARTISQQDSPANGDTSASNDSASESQSGTGETSHDENPPDAQISLTDLTEEEKQEWDVAFEGPDARYHQLNTSTKQWEKFAGGPFRIVKNKKTGVGRILVRQVPSGKVLINSRLLPGLKYENPQKGNRLKVQAVNQAGGLDVWVVAFGNRKFATEGCELLETLKNVQAN